MVRTGSGVVKQKAWGKRKGFKLDRRANYLLLKKGIARTSPKAKKILGINEKPVKEIVFEPEKRKEYVLGFHKRKNERRAVAQYQARLQQHRKNREERKDLREEARAQYNAMMQVPINPDFTFIRNLQKVGIVSKDEEDNESDQTGDNVESEIISLPPVNKAPVPYSSCSTALTKVAFDCPTFGQGSVYVSTAPICYRTERERTAQLLNEHKAQLDRILLEKQERRKRISGTDGSRTQVVVQKELARLRRIRTHTRKSKKNKRKAKKKPVRK